jgi:hypothetical protein
VELIKVGVTTAEAPYHSLNDIVTPEAFDINPRISLSFIDAVVPEVPPAST